VILYTPLWNTVCPLCPQVAIAASTWSVSSRPKPNGESVHVRGCFKFFDSQSDSNRPAEQVARKRKGVKKRMRIERAFWLPFEFYMQGRRCEMTADAVTRLRQDDRPGHWICSVTQSAPEKWTKKTQIFNYVHIDQDPYPTSFFCIGPEKSAEQLLQ
jgi:hypothetical protein